MNEIPLIESIILARHYLRDNIQFFDQYTAFPWIIANRSAALIRGEEIE
jgi:hypothetical protein